MTKHRYVCPPFELVKEWIDEAVGDDFAMELAFRAADWGSDQELDACCTLLDNGEHAASYGCHNGASLREARRPNPSKLKKQALQELGRAEQGGNITPERASIIRKALGIIPG